jgi:calcineurin-like phosphoesterase family protein
MPNVWFTADSHLGHEAILRHMPERGKVFASIEEMDAHVVDETNRVVGKNDILIHAGDFAWRAGRVGHYRHRLNVRQIHVARGNHDAASLVKHVSTMELILFKKFDGHDFHIEHRPCLSWNKKQRGGFHVYGHSHGLFEDTLNTLWPGRRAIDVGIDHAFRLTGEWRPLSLDEVLHFIEHATIPVQCNMHADTCEHHQYPGDYVSEHREPGIWRTSPHCPG